MLRRQLCTGSFISTTLLSTSSQSQRFCATDSSSRSNNPTPASVDPSATNGAAASLSTTKSIHRDLLKRSKLVAKPATPTPPPTEAAAAGTPPKKATLRPFVPVKYVLFGTTTVSGGIDGIVNASIDALVPAGGEGTLSQQVLLWMTTFLSARPAHQEAVTSDNGVLPIITVLCELEKDVYSSAREHKKSSIYKASKDKAATTMDNARLVHHALDHAAQARFLELKVEAAGLINGEAASSNNAYISQRIELAGMLVNNVLIPLYEARLVALSNDFIGFIDRFDAVSRNIDEIMLRAHVFELSEKVANSTPLIDLYIDDNVRNSSAIISGGAMSAPNYFSEKRSRLSLPADDSVTITLTPVAAAAKASLLAPATNILLVLYADKQYINNNVRGILQKHRELKETTAAKSSTTTSSTAGGPTISVSAANAPTLKMPSWMSSGAKKGEPAAGPPPANLSPETVLKVASSTQVLPHTLTRSTVDRESINLRNALEYPHPIADDEDKTDIHGNKAPKLTSDEKKRRQQQIVEENKFLQHTPTVAMIQSVIAKAYGVNSYTFSKSQKVHYAMTVVVPMAIRFIKGDLPFLLATISEEAKGANKNKAPVVETPREDLEGAPNFPHFLDMRHSTAGTTPWHPAFSLFATSRPVVLSHHPSHATAAIFPFSRDDFGFLIGLSLPLILGFFLGVYIMINLGKGIYWAVQWLIDEGVKAVAYITTETPKSITTTTVSTVGTPVMSTITTSAVSISASSLIAALGDDDEPKKK